MIKQYFRTIFSPFQAISSNFGFSIFWPNLCGLDPDIRKGSHSIFVQFSRNFSQFQATFFLLPFFDKDFVGSPPIKSLFDIRKWSHSYYAILVGHSTHYQTVPHTFYMSSMFWPNFCVLDPPKSNSIFKQVSRHFRQFEATLVFPFFDQICVVSTLKLSLFDIRKWSHSIFVQFYRHFRLFQATLFFFHFLTKMLWAQPP